MRPATPQAEMIGKTLSHYRIEEELGEGGMGAVYVAEDTSLDRKIALKVLAPEMAGDRKRRARFDREAKAIAALNHPNIVTIYSVEEDNGVHFITMEWVQGQTLSQIIPSDGFTLSEFLKVAVPVADAIGAAHEQGILHRDLKPDNIMVGEDGRVKILDFGLAKLKYPETGDAAVTQVATESVTEEGHILGTVAYMSPEQAEAKPVDHRADIFSLGIIFYEMLTGEHPFKGDSAGSIIASILRDTPSPVTELKDILPQRLGRITKRCLEKDPTRRYQHSLDIRNALEELKADLNSGELSTMADAPEPMVRRRPSLSVMSAALAVVFLIGLLAGYLVLSPPLPTSLMEQPSVEASFAQLTYQTGLELYSSLSPDGEFLVYASASSGNWDVYLQRVGGERVINLTEDSAEDDLEPAFSPDGKQIAFRSAREGGGVFIMGATGESVRRMSDFGANPTWSPDGNEILFATESFTDPRGRGADSHLWAAHVQSGELRRVTEGGDAVQPRWSPHGHRIVYWGVKIGSGQRDLWTIPAEGGDPTPVTDDAHTDWSPVWSPDGHFLYFSSDRGGSMNIWRVAIDEQSGEVRGEPQAITTGISNAAYMSFSRDGKQLAYSVIKLTSNIQRISFDPLEGTVEGEPVWITRGSSLFDEPNLSPDDQWVAFRQAGKQEDIFVIRQDGTVRRQLTNDLHKDRRPRWSPVGKRIAFYSDRSGSYELWSINADGSGLRQLTNTPGESVWYPSWSPNGMRLAAPNSDRRSSVVFDLDENGVSTREETLPRLSESDDWFAVYSWSSNGKRLAGYISEVSGEDAGIVIYDLESKSYEKLTDFGAYPLWLNDNKRLIFEDKGKIYLLSSETKQYREIFSAKPDGLSLSAISRDNSAIYFARNTAEADIWLLTLDQDRDQGSGIRD